MTPALYTLASLEAMTDRDLDAVVASVVFGWLGGFQKGAFGWYGRRDETDPYCPLPCYVGNWEGVGQVFERMLSLGWSYEVDATALEAGIDVNFHPNNPAFRVKGTSSTLSRAAAIAAILAVQGAA